MKWLAMSGHRRLACRNRTALFPLLMPRSVNAMVSLAGLPLHLTPKAPPKDDRRPGARARCLAI